MTDGREQTARMGADVAIMTVRDGCFAVLLARRERPPFPGRLALPGGGLGPSQTLAAVAERELRRHARLSARDARLEQVGVYSEPGRDPRGRAISVSYAAMIPGPTAAAPDAGLNWIPVDRALGQPGHLAFDHWKILADAAEHARRRLEYSTVATSFCPAEFTVAELRRVYETIWDTCLDPGNFHRKVTRIDGFLEPVGRTTGRDGGRPAALYRSGERRHLPLPIGRP